MLVRRAIRAAARVRGAGSDHAQLMEYARTPRPRATLFDEADINADLASDLSVAQLQQLLPSEALLGHALRLYRVLAEAARPQPRIPAGPAWQLQGQILGWYSHSRMPSIRLSSI